jgi:ribosomal subunit interface protein
MNTNEEPVIEFKGRHEHISARMQEHASKKLMKLAHFKDRIARIEVVAEHAHENPEVELIVHMRRGQPLVAKEHADTFSTTIDQLVDKMEKQLRKQKEIRKDHKVPGLRGATGEQAGKGESGKVSGEETYEDVVRKSLRG